MAYTAYDWQQTLAEKADYAESRLRHGAPVVALSYDKGILLLTFRKNQGKIFEVYDRLAMGAMGNPSDLEAVRQYAVDFSHSEGYQRSIEDVSVQRVVGFAISPSFKTAFSDPRRMPVVLNSIFTQVGETPEDDMIFVLNYDGEFHRHEGHAHISGNKDANARMHEVLHDAKAGNQKSAIELALKAWAAGQWKPKDHSSEDEDKILLPTKDEREKLFKKQLDDGARIEAAVLERDTQRERRYQVLDKETLAPFLP